MERNEMDPGQAVDMPADDPNVAAAPGGGVNHEDHIGEELPGDGEDDAVVDAAVAEDEDDLDGDGQPDPPEDADGGQ